MEKISELMDGELDTYEAELHLKRLKEDSTLREQWDLYHLVGDTLRQESGLSARIAKGVSARLEQEPTVMAPRYTAPRKVTRYAMSAAAGVAGLAVVGWLAFTGMPGTGTPQQVAVVPSPALRVVAPSGPVQAQATALQAGDAEVEDYLLAHQAASEFRTMHGGPLYVRPVVAEAGR